MAEYIEREAAIAEILKGTITTSDLYGMGVESGMDIALERVKSIHAADVEPVRHGRWVKDGDFLICLNCESEINIKNSLGVENHKSYCPNCGAKMDLEVSE